MSGTANSCQNCVHFGAPSLLCGCPCHGELAAAPMASQARAGEAKTLVDAIELICSLRVGLAAAEKRASEAEADIAVQHDQIAAMDTTIIELRAKLALTEACYDKQCAATLEAWAMADELAECLRRAEWAMTNGVSDETKAFGDVLRDTAFLLSSYDAKKGGV